ncbi:hypothetical protein [Streptomyces sp. TLI_053]|uniref:hypothetical protein n=1 Tax=Streptomyces sp. TLI_053 TaxID=1855352 RepID=UPI0013520C0A|nr:hypothetical protein [Streptomyces sp. TLI_053]
MTSASLWRSTLLAARRAARSAARAEAAARSVTALMAAAGTGDHADAPASAAPSVAPSVAKTASTEAAPTKPGPARPGPVKTTPTRPAPTKTAPTKAAATAGATPKPKPKPKPKSKPVHPRTPTTAEADLPRLRPATGPSDDRGPVPHRQEGERFHFSGRCEGEDSEYEFPIEWPEDAAAVAQIEVATAGYLSIKPVTRTRDRIETHSSLVFLSSSGKRTGVRTLLTRDFTHLLVDSNGPGEWSVRLYSPDEIDELAGVMEGYGSTVLAVGPDTPVDCVAHVKSSSWSAVFLCACGRTSDAFKKCGCPVPPGVPRNPTLGAFSNGEALRTLQLPRPGVLQLQTSKPSDPWRLEIRRRTSGPQDR